MIMSLAGSDETKDYAARADKKALPLFLKKNFIPSNKLMTVHALPINDRKKAHLQIEDVY